MRKASELSLSLEVLKDFTVWAVLLWAGTRDQRHSSSLRVSEQGRASRWSLLPKWECQVSFS